MMSDEKRNLQLSADLCHKAEQLFGGRFATVEELLTNVLQKLVGRDAIQMDIAEQKVIEQRLKDLGYV